VRLRLPADLRATGLVAARDAHVPPLCRGDGSHSLGSGALAWATVCRPGNGGG
jgi:hypothetical protein